MNGNCVPQISGNKRSQKGEKSKLGTFVLRLCEYNATYPEDYEYAHDRGQREHTASNKDLVIKGQQTVSKRVWEKGMGKETNRNSRGLLAPVGLRCGGHASTDLTGDNRCRTRSDASRPIHTLLEHGREGK